MPIAICIQKPVQPKREKAFAMLSLIDGLKILLSACNITSRSPSAITYIWGGVE